MASSKERRRAAARGLARIAQAALVVLACAGASDAVPVVPSASGGGPPLVVIACAPATPAPRVLLVQRVFIATGSRTATPTVPAWAGQWGMIAGSAPSGGSVQQNAGALFAAQTAQSFPSGATFSVKIVNDPTDFASTQYAIVQLSESALEQLASATNAAIAAGTPAQGVLSAAQTVGLPDALQQLGPVPPPPGGWTAYVIREYYGGVPPGALDPTLPLLVNLLATRTQQTTDAFQEALLLAGSCDG